MKHSGKQQPDISRRGCVSSSCNCGGPNRRDFLTSIGVGAVAATSGVLPVMAGPFEASDFEKLIPADKKLSPDWIKSLFARGTPTVYRGKDLERIGMPIGGICSGQLYLGGDGRLWRWDVFNHSAGTGDRNYASPPRPDYALDQGFALRLHFSGTTQVRSLDSSGFSDITFCGQYPIGQVTYKDPASPVAVALEAFSPFIPLNTDDSSLPATVLKFTVKNISEARVEAELAGWLENAVCRHTGDSLPITRSNHVERRKGVVLLECRVEPLPTEKGASHRPPTVFEDFESGTYDKWTVEGEAFGKRPAKIGEIFHHEPMKGAQGNYLADSFLASNDRAQGRLLSKSFVIDRPYINFLIGGGHHPGETCINLLVDGRVVRTATGRDSETLRWENWRVQDWIGKAAQFEILDKQSGGWGHVLVDQIELADQPKNAIGDPRLAFDFGTMALVLFQATDKDLAAESISQGKRPEGVFAPSGLASDGPSRVPAGQKLCGALGRKLDLAPGQEATVTFAITWCFPNLELGRLGKVGRHYARRYPTAGTVADDLADRLPALAAQTRLWRDTWYDSTLPYWFLDRTLCNVSVLATSTCYRFANGRFYGWEGVGCCEGTCTHVWHYAHAAARLFPELERSAREMADFGAGFDPRTGLIDFRGEFHNGFAADGQAGCVLRTYREHQMSADSAFLKRNWPKIKRALECLIAHDTDGDGILDGAQHNTLDAAWFGKIAWLSTLYVAALRAGQHMALEMGDGNFAERTASLAETGSRNIDQQLFNGEYYYQIGDSKHHVVGSYDGCETDQVFGQSWAFQIGLKERILPKEHTLAALHSIWRYNFTPDVGPYRRAYKPGRWYAMPGEGGLIGCTWPRGEGQRVKQGYDYYFNECQTGYEYQPAGHMIWEGMVMEGLAIARAIHDRYHASRRNPWNEVECGDHYARSMASYGLFLAACGYEYHGPRRHLAFAPRLSPEDFRAAFTTAEGWGSFSQKDEAGARKARVRVQWGNLRLKTLALMPPTGSSPATVVVNLADKPVEAQLVLADGRLLITLVTEITIEAGQELLVVLA